MLLTVLILGGTILGATTIAGYLMLQKIQIASNITNSTRAIFGADSGLEWEMYRKFVNAGQEKPVFSNGVTFATVVNEDGSSIKSIGISGKTNRALEVNFVVTPPATP